MMTMISKITSEIEKALCNFGVSTQFAFSIFALAQYDPGFDPQINKKARNKAAVQAIMITIMPQVSQWYHLDILALKMRRKKNIKLSFIKPSVGICSNSKGQKGFDH